MRKLPSMPNNRFDSNAVKKGKGMEAQWFGGHWAYSCMSFFMELPHSNDSIMKLNWPTLFLELSNLPKVH